MEDFYTIQGEGAYQGRAAYFIRLGGCDVGCVWCDVKESWDVNAHPIVAVDDIVGRAKKSGCGLAVITGGEPAHYDLGVLTQRLRSEGFRTHIETSGAYEISGAWDWVCLSPKKFKAPVASSYPIANELKVVVFNKNDLAWAEQHAVLVKPNCALYLQPEWSKEKDMIPVIVEYVKSNPRWRISLQVHKYLNIP